MKKFLALLMCLMMMLTMMTACGEDAEKSGKKSDEELIIGNWEATYDMGDLLNEMLASMMGEDVFNIGEFEVIMEMSFDEDGIYTMSVDQDSFEEGLDGIMDDLKDGLVDYMEALLEESGITMSLDEYLELSGTTMDELMEESFDMASITESFESEGKYELDDGKLYTSDDPDEDVAKDSYETYELSEDELKITGVEGEEAEDAEEFMMDIYPLVFERK